MSDNPTPEPTPPPGDELPHITDTAASNYVPPEPTPEPTPEPASVRIRTPAEYTVDDGPKPAAPLDEAAAMIQRGSVADQANDV